MDGTTLRDVRKRAGVSLARMAELTSFHKSTLGHYETGERRITTEVVQAYEKALGTTLRDEDMNRRELLKAAAGLAATEPLLRLVDELVVPAQSTARVGMSEVEAVRQATGFAAAMDFQFGGEHAVRIGSGSLTWSVKLLDGSMTPDTRRALSSAVGALADRVAYSLHDSEQRSQALKIATLAVRASSEGDDPTLRTHVLIDIASFTARSSPREGVSILRPSFNDKKIYSQERANVHFAAARMLANDKRPHEALDCFRAGEKILSKDPATDAPASVGFIRTPGHWDSVTGGVLMRIGQEMDPRQAKPVFGEAVARLTSAFNTFGPDRGRAKALLLVKLARLEMDLGDLGAAHDLTSQAEARSAEVQSRRLRTFVSELRSGLAQRA
ncbi:helix-turn-helix domain-containing protein [Amycolatopsis sp. NPDC059027]|uniref:helix-turn-helix domain-containing protein n=1 Tax=Amycolatopsis sp. NPDC059027 TaxID=3346709 RepID=UPI00366DAEA3